MLSATAIDNTTVEVTFSRPIELVNELRFVIEGGPFPVVVGDRTLQPDQRTVRVSTTPQTTAQYTISVLWESDGPSPLGEPNSATYTGMPDTVAPHVASVTAPTLTTVDVFFSEPLATLRVSRMWRTTWSQVGPTATSLSPLSCLSPLLRSDSPRTPSRTASIR